MPRLPDTQSFIERLQEQNPDWDDYEEDDGNEVDDDNEDVQKGRRKAEAEYYGQDNNDKDITK